MLASPLRQSSDNYQAGISLRLLPRTTINYDHFYRHFKDDSSSTLSGLAYALAGGTPVDLGLAFNTLATQPCATPLLPTLAANPACNGYLGYSSWGAARNSFHTDEVSLQSSYFRRLELTGSVAYSSGDTGIPSYLENYAGLTTRTRMRSSVQTGSTLGRRVSADADLGITLRITDRFRMVDSFRFDNYRLPNSWNLTTSALFGANLLSTPNQFSPATCPPPFTAATCPQHNASSGADVTNDVMDTFLKHDEKVNRFELQYDITRRLMARVGHRFVRRSLAESSLDVQDLTFYPSLPNRGVCTGLALVNGVCTTGATSASHEELESTGHSLLAGVTARPAHGLRLGLDTEWFYSDHAFTRINPRKEARYRGQVNYTPRAWAVLGGSINLLENSNRDALTNYRGHNRSYGFNATLSPRERFGVDLAYNYSDYLQNALICFNDTPPTGVTLSVITTAGDCTRTVNPANPYNDSGNPRLTDSYYVNQTHFGLATVMFRPVRRVATQLGYSITSVGGRSPVFNQLQPDSSLHYNYHQPLASLGVDLGHHVAWNTAWNYYGYNEKALTGPTAPRYFHANTATVSLRYSF
jgi:hypothetical protein